MLKKKIERKKDRKKDAVMSFLLICTFIILGYSDPSTLSVIMSLTLVKGIVIPLDNDNVI